MLRSYKWMDGRVGLDWKSTYRNWLYVRKLYDVLKLRSNLKCVLKEIWLCFERNQIVFWKKSIVFWQRLSTLLMLGRCLCWDIWWQFVMDIHIKRSHHCAIFIDIYVQYIFYIYFELSTSQDKIKTMTKTVTQIFLKYLKSPAISPPSRAQE